MKKLYGLTCIHFIKQNLFQNTEFNTNLLLDTLIDFNYMVYNTPSVFNNFFTYEELYLFPKSDLYLRNIHTWDSDNLDYSLFKKKLQEVTVKIINYI